MPTGGGPLILSEPIPKKVTFFGTEYDTLQDAPSCYYQWTRGQVTGL